MAITKQTRLTTLFGFILVLLLILMGSYFYIQKISYEAELKLNALKEESIEVSERNKVLINREKATLDRLSVLQKENESLKSERDGLMQLNETLQQEKGKLTEEIETIKSVNTQSSLPLMQPLIPPRNPTTMLVPVKSVVPSDETPKINMLRPEKPAPTPTEPNALLCPTKDVVNQNLEQGNWAQNKMTWWVEFSSRPLDEGEKVGSFFKALSEKSTTQAVSCYYQIGEAFIAIKMSVPEGHQIATQSNHWKPCQETESCVAICESDDLNQCPFLVETP
ncbi:MAG: hypothetical protein U1E78_06640 [Gammaproteobacteria bacterium]